MYHKVSPNESHGLTISATKLEEQFLWLSENEYHSYHLSELYAMQRLPSKRSVVITFDDGYVSQLEWAIPLLEKYRLKATFFIPLKYVGATDEWNDPSFPLMTSEQLKKLDPKIIELGYHSYAHRMYHQMSSAEIEEDTMNAFDIASKEELYIKPILAYPYGKFPRKNPHKANFFELLKSHHIHYGLRIGNRVNRFPFKDPFEINRIDVKGEFTLPKFRRKLRFGKFF